MEMSILLVCRYACMTTRRLPGSWLRGNNGVVRGPWKEQ